MCWNPTFQPFDFCCCRIISVPHRPSGSQALYLWQPWYNSSRTSALPFATATDDASVCARATFAGGRAIQTHTSSGFQKQPRSHRYNNSSSTTASALQTLASVTTTVLLCLHVCTELTRCLCMHSILIKHVVERHPASTIPGTRIQQCSE